MSKVSYIFSNLNRLKEKYLRMSIGKESLITLLNESEISEQVYNSNAIENSTLSLDETEKILLELDLNRYISQRELFEAKNLAKVVTYINNKAKEKELNKELILFLHKMLLANIDENIAGRFREKNEWVRVGSHIALDPSKIKEAITEMFISHQMMTSENIIKKVSLLHLTFEGIHPFNDGNGRIGRVINNYILIREGFIPINIKFIDRERYYDAFKEFDKNKNTSIMEDIVGKALSSSYHRRLAYLEGKEIITLLQYSKIKKLSHPNLINKAKRQTIEAFLEKGVWKIGV